MMDKPPSNVKVYDRPERKGPSPLLLVVALLIVLVIGFFVYKALHHSVPPVNSPSSFVIAQRTLLQETWQESINR